jgi:hypothetical protein
MGFNPKPKETADEQQLLLMSWEGEYLGTAFFKALLKKFPAPEYKEGFQASMAMEYWNIGYCKSIAAPAGVHLTVDQVDKLEQQAADMVAKFDTFEDAEKAVADEMPGTVKMYMKMADGASSAEVKTLGIDFAEHEQAFAAWMHSVVEGNSDGAKRVFAYLENHGVSREEALTPLEV